MPSNHTGQSDCAGKTMFVNGNDENWVWGCWKDTSSLLENVYIPSSDVFHLFRYRHDVVSLHVSSGKDYIFIYFQKGKGSWPSGEQRKKEWFRETRFCDVRKPFIFGACAAIWESSHYLCILCCYDFLSNLIVWCLSKSCVDWGRFGFSAIFVTEKISQFINPTGEE